MANEYFVNGTIPEKVEEEGLRLYRKCMSDAENDKLHCDRALYLYPDGSMNVIEGDEWPDPELRALCIASYSPSDADYMSTAFEKIVDSIMADISKEEQQKILDYVEANGCSIDAFKVCQPELFEQYDNDAREEALNFEREKLEKTVSDIEDALNDTHKQANKRSLSDVKKAVTEKKSEATPEAPVKHKKLSL